MLYEKAEIDGSREVLLGAVEPMQRGQLLGAQHAKCLEELGADFVLATVAARRRCERRPITLAAIQHHEQRVVLVVGMGGRLHEDAGVREVPQREPERHVSALLVHRHDPHLTGNNRRSDDESSKKTGEASHSMILPGMGGIGRIPQFLPFQPVLRPRFRISA